MAAMSRRSSVASTSAAAAAAAVPVGKRPAAAENSMVGKAAPAATQQQAKKRVALASLPNQCNAGRIPARTTVAKVANNVSGGTFASSAKKGSATLVRDTSQPCNSGTRSSVTKPAPIISSKTSVRTAKDVPPSKSTVSTFLVPCSTARSSHHSGDSISLDETMSTCDSMKSPDFEYIDNEDSSIVASLERRANDNLRISEHRDVTGYTWKRNDPIPMDTSDNIVDVDNNYEDPQLCATLACDIYKHLRIAEAKKRPSTDFMERIQKDVNASMRAILIDWLVEVAEEYRLVPDTLYLTVNYIDRYLSGNEMNRQKLQLLGVACMLIASKYEEICAPQVEEFCYITDNTYFKDEVLQMEAAVLKYLKFEMTAPTAKCFLRRFVRAAQGCDEVSALQLEFLANYLAELSLLEYHLLCYSPSQIAAASLFLAKFILQPTKRPWNSTLLHYTLYRPCDLRECVSALHRLFCDSPGSSLPAIREKYSQHKYKFVAKKYCPPSIPPEFFQDLSN